jgi:hypothetical protein
MRVMDAQNGIRDALNSMDWYRYLFAMGMICGEFQAGYNSRPRSADHVECDDDAMMDAVLAATFGVASAGTVSPEAAREAAELWRRWRALAQRIDRDMMDLAQLRLRSGTCGRRRTLPSRAPCGSITRTRK